MTLQEKINWALKHPTNKKGAKITNIEEKKWGNRMICNDDKLSCQWTTKLGENLVFEVLKLLKQNPRRPETKGGYKPDWETDEYIYEVKTRNWTTPGTAGEKVYGCPLKYAEIPDLYSKPLRIICVAYQEYEFTYGRTPIFGEKVRSAQQKFIDFYKTNDIYFVAFYELIKTIKIDEIN